VTSPHALPAGLVTFVFTDIEGSTRLFRAHPDAYPVALAEHREILRSAWRSFGGVEVNTEGDGMLVAFADAAAAVGACAAAQQALATHEWPGGIDLRVRMGAHSGLAHPLDGDYVAIAVHQAARVAAVANGRQVVLSESTAALAGRSGVTLRDRGRYRVRDFEEPVRLFDVEIAGVASPPTLLRAVPAENTNVRGPSTSFVGRRDDLLRVQSLLEPGQLVTLVGPGGVGKSRLAAEVVEQVAASWPDGAWRVGVDELSEPSALVPAVAQALSIGLGDDPLRDLMASLAERRLLLVLDGSEMLLDSVAHLVDEVLHSCPTVGVLATGREPLHLAGERVHRLAPLATTGEGVPDALTLLLDRAHLVEPEFGTHPGDTEALRTLVTRLDGLPLAIEVAAGFASAFTPAQMVDGLQAGALRLESRTRSLPPRHRSLETLLAWSEQTLSEGERATLRRLSMFTGSFSLEAARQAAAWGDVDADAVTEHVWSLVDRSLLLTDSTSRSRYRMLELVRQFSAARLRSAGETIDVWRRVATWLGDHLGPTQWHRRDWYGRAQAEATVLRGLATTPVESADDERVGQMLGVVLARLDDAAQAYRTGSDEVALLAERYTAPSPVRVSLLAAVAWLELQAGHTARAEAWASEASALRDEVGAPGWDPVGVERALGEAAIRRGDPAAAAQLALEALSRPMEPRARARMHNMLSIARLELGDVGEALSASSDTLDSCEATGDPVLMASALGNLAETAFRAGHTVDAARHQRRALTLAEALGQPVAIAYALNLAGRMVLAAADISGTADGVRLVSRSASMLDDAGQALYPEDASATAAALAEALRRLGPQEYRAAERDGASTPVPVAIERATQVLANVSGDAPLGRPDA